MRTKSTPVKRSSSETEMLHISKRPRRDYIQEGPIKPNVAFEQVLKIVRLYSTEQKLRSWNLPFNALVPPHGWETRQRGMDDGHVQMLGRILFFFNHVDEWIVDLLGEYAPLTKQMYDSNGTELSLSYFLKTEDPELLEAYSKNGRRLVFHDALLQIEGQEAIHDAAYRIMLDIFTCVTGIERDRGYTLPKLDYKLDVEIAKMSNGDDATLIVFNFLAESCVLPVIFDWMYRMKGHVIDKLPELSQVFLTNDEIIGDETIHGAMWRDVLRCCSIDVFKFERVAIIFLNVLLSVLKSDLDEMTLVDASELYWSLIESLWTGNVVKLRYMDDNQSFKFFSGNRLGYQSVNLVDVEKMIEGATK